MKQEVIISLMLSMLLVLAMSGCSPLAQKEVQEPSSAEHSSAQVSINPPPQQEKRQPISAPQPTQNQPLSSSENHRERRRDFSPIFTPLYGCEEKGRITFTSLPMDLSAITVVEPLGELTNAGHIIPGDHGGFQYDPKGPPVNIYAMADGYIVKVERNRPFYEIKSKNYHLYVEYSCSMFGSYVHVTEIDHKILAADASFKALDALTEVQDNQRTIAVRIPIKAGQMLGKAKEWGLLGMLTVDSNVTLSGFANPNRYDDEPWKIHAVSPLDYMKEPMRSQLLAKNPRKKEPRSGKIDFDIPGKLRGNWFREGSNYKSNQEQIYCGKALCPYWESHLAFVPDFIDPDQMRISLGYSTGIAELEPYGIKDNSPNPAQVSPLSGIVKFELVQLEDHDADAGVMSQGKALVTKNSQKAVGTMLVEMLDSKKIKVEVFAKKDAAAVNEFTSAARVYVR